MNALEHSSFDHPEEYGIEEVIEAFQQEWHKRFEHFCYAPMDFTGESDQEIMLGLARSVINLASDYKRVAEKLHEIQAASTQQTAPRHITDLMPFDPETMTEKEWLAEYSAICD
jgi:hypothetical protein